MTSAPEFRQRLLEDRRRLLRALVGTDEELATLEAHQPGAFDEDVMTGEVAVLLSRLEGRQKHELDNIDEALRKLEGGRFGLCEACGRAIALARLRALPAARLCMECQRRHESG